MKSKILKLSTILMLILFVGVSCNKDELEYADESVVVSSWPWLSVYETKGDYIDKIIVGINDNGEIISYPDFHEKSEGVIINSKGQYKYKSKWLLSSGYVVVQGGEFNCAVTDISLTEYINFNEPYKTNWNIDMLQKRIVDSNPFTTYYLLDGLNKAEKTFTIGQINDMVEKGTLEEHFTKLK